MAPSPLLLLPFTGHAIVTGKAGYVSWALGACLLLGVHFDSPSCQMLSAFSALLVPTRTVMCQGLLVGKCYADPGLPTDVNTPSYGPTRESQGIQNNLRQPARPYSGDDGGSLGAGYPIQESGEVASETNVDRFRSPRRNGRRGGQTDMDDLSSQLNEGARITGPGSQQNRQERIKFYCPVPSCMHHQVRRNTGWFSKQSLKTHIDRHLVCYLGGSPTDEFLASQNWTICPVCNLTAAANRRGGVHDDCAHTYDAMQGSQVNYESQADSSNRQSTEGQRQQRGGRVSELEKLQEYERNLPTIEDISLFPTTPKKHSNKGLRKRYREIHGKLVARGNESCVYDAGDVGEGSPDNVAKVKTRIAWIEEAMFYKAVLMRDKRGLKPTQSYAAAKNRLDRWEQGERKTLWDDLQRPKQHKKKQQKQTEERKLQRVNQLVEQGKAGKALNSATSPGLAWDTPDVQKMLESKFPQRTQGNRSRPIPPFQHQATREQVVKEIRSFANGATPGVTGLWPQFLKDMIGAKGDEDIIDVYVERAQLFTDGRVPGFLRPWYGGGRLVDIGKDDEPLDKDARPLVVW